MQSVLTVLYTTFHHLLLSAFYFRTNYLHFHLPIDSFIFLSFLLVFLALVLSFFLCFCLFLSSLSFFFFCPFFFLLIYSLSLSLSQGGGGQCVDSQTAAFSSAPVYSSAKPAQKLKSCSSTVTLSELSEYDKVIIPKKTRNSKKGHEGNGERFEHHFSFHLKEQVVIFTAFNLPKICRAHFWARNMGTKGWIQIHLMADLNP